MHCPGGKLLTAALVLVSLGWSALGEDPPRLVMKRAAGRIELDGKLDDPGWRAAAGFARFVFLGSDTPDYRKARGMLAYDDKNLYVAVECEEDDAGDKFTEPGKGDTFPGGPHVEVWIQSPKPRGNMERDGLQFCANALGARYDGRLAMGGAPQAFDGKWRCGGRRLAGKWTVEMAIPFADIGLGGPLPAGQPLRMDVGRASPLVSWAGSWGGLPEFDELGLVFFGSDKGYVEPRTPADPNPRRQKLYVSPKGSDDSPGTKAKPFKTIQRAVDAAGPGDTVEVAAPDRRLGPGARCGRVRHIGLLGSSRRRSEQGHGQGRRSGCGPAERVTYAAPLPPWMIVTPTVAVFAM